MFRTDLPIAPQERQLVRTARILTLGSCFADSLGERLRLNKVTTLANPFGTVFQPLALAQLLRAAAGEAQDWQQHVVEARGRWQSFDFHGSVGAESPVELLQAIQEMVERVGSFVRTADAVVLTLGTAWAYRLRETGELVSNLHKLPAALFEKELLTADEIVNGLAEVHALLRRLNPGIRIILTVSPVRHLKDTLPLNAVSKSVLRVACHYLSELLPGVSYFPAYELLTDDLRDYRFYAADMLHPSPVAEDYIWDKFARAYFDADFGRFRKEWEAVRRALGHRPLHLGAPEHRTFLDQTRERLEQLLAQGVEVRQELRDVQRQLAALPPPKPAYVAPEPEDDEERIDIGGEESEIQLTNNQPDAVPTGVAERRADNPRHRRDDRRNGRDNRPDRSGRGRRDGQPAAAPMAAEAFVTDDEVLAVEIPVADSVAADVQELLLDPAAELLPETDTAAYPAKKKKRRSRGGAKRTARKNAARLAAEQEGEVPASLAEAELTEELAREAAGFLPEAALKTLANASEVPDDLPRAEPLADGVPATSETEALPPASTITPRKRGTGPTPKKSKVITKSGLLPRGKRTSLFRAAAPSPATPAAPQPAAAPIISPPIIPEILLERPAIAQAIFTSPPEPVAASGPEPTPAPAIEPAVEFAPPGEATKPTPRRGRPKASPPATEEATAPVASKPVKKTTKTPKSTAAKKVAAPKKAAPKKPAARKTAKPAAPPADEAPAA